MQQTFFASLVKDKEKNEKKVEDLVTGPEGFESPPSTHTGGMTIATLMVLGDPQARSWLITSLAKRQRGWLWNENEKVSEK
jgi:hypothetical protein